MTVEMPEIGKISPEIFKELISPRLGITSDKVIVGPDASPFPFLLSLKVEDSA